MTQWYYVKRPKRNSRSDDEARLASGNPYWFHNLLFQLEHNNIQVAISKELPKHDGFEWVSIKTSDTFHYCNVPKSWLFPAVPLCAKCKEPMKICK